MKFLPDGIKFKYLKRDFLFSILYHKRPEVYAELVALSEREKELSKRKLLADCAIKVVDRFREKLLNLPDLKEYEMRENHRF